MSVAPAQARPISPETLESLLLVREIFGKAETFARDSSRFSRMMAPLLYDLSVETALKLVAAERLIPKTETSDLGKLLEAVRKAVNQGRPLPRERDIKELRDERNQVQHGATPRSNEAIVKGAAAAKELVSFLIREVFELDFGGFSAHALLPAGRLRILLDRAEEEFQSERYTQACALACRVFAAADGETAKSWGKVYPRPGRNVLGGRSENGASNHADKVAERLESIVIALSNGYDPNELGRFLRTSADCTVTETADGKLTFICWSDKVVSSEDARWALNFAATHAFRVLQREPMPDE